MIYKYFTEEAHAQAFMRRGSMRFRPLSWFRQYEGDAARGDRNDGVLIFNPEAGLEINRADGRKEILKGWRFESSAREEDIFVHCMSLRLAEDVATRFESPWCVEITDAEALAARLRARQSRTSHLDYATLLARNVEYRARDALPQADWALPDRLAFIKPEEFAYQDEYRIAIGKHGALDPENVKVFLRRGEPDPVAAAELALPLDLGVGDLRDLAVLHRF